MPDALYKGLVVFITLGAIDGGWCSASTPLKQSANVSAGTEDSEVGSAFGNPRVKDDARVAKGATDFAGRPS